MIMIRDGDPEGDKFTPESLHEIKFRYTVDNYV